MYIKNPKTVLNFMTIGIYFCDAVYILKKKSHFTDRYSLMCILHLLQIRAHIKNISRLSYVISKPRNKYHSSKHTSNLYVNVILICISVCFVKVCHE